MSSVRIEKEGKSEHLNCACQDSLWYVVADGADILREAERWKK